MKIQQLKQAKQMAKQQHVIMFKCEKSAKSTRKHNEACSMASISKLRYQQPSLSEEASASHKSCADKRKAADIRIFAANACTCLCR